MIVLDPGHLFTLHSLDGASPQTITFVKREGEGYPGNVGHHQGTNIQEVCRALISRLDYLNHQIPCAENRKARKHLQEVIYLLEKRAAKRHGRILKAKLAGIEVLPFCPKCGHIECEKHL